MVTIVVITVCIRYFAEISNQPATKQVSTSLHETITNIENLLDANNYNGCIQRFYDLVERCSDTRPVNMLALKVHFLHAQI